MYNLIYTVTIVLFYESITIDPNLQANTILFSVLTKLNIPLGAQKLHKKKIKDM